jgi:hypothetical protein
MNRKLELNYPVLELEDGRALHRQGDDWCLLAHDRDEGPVRLLVKDACTSTSESRIVRRVGSGRVPHPGTARRVGFDWERVAQVWGQWIGRAIEPGTVRRAELRARMEWARKHEFTIPEWMWHTDRTPTRLHYLHARSDGWASFRYEGPSRKVGWDRFERKPIKGYVRVQRVQASGHTNRTVEVMHHSNFTVTS